MSAILTAEPGDVVEFERDGQRFGGVVWQPPSQPDNLLAGDTFIRLKGEWIATTEHVVSHRRKHERENAGRSSNHQSVRDGETLGRVRLVSEPPDASLSEET